MLNRPRVINAYNMQMRDELFETLEAVRDDPDVRVAILSGAGDRGFCAGADLTEFGTAPSIAIARQVRWERDVWGLFLSIRKPLIAALHGFVIGSGVEIACLCDIRIASNDAVFRMPEVALGMVPAAGGTQTLPRIIGLAPSLEMILTNRVIRADEAKRLGLVHEVVTKAKLLDRAGRIAKELAERDESALAAAKEAILAGMDMPLNQGLALEERLAARLFG
jgi:enoyl-CoA hydratase/carnithine racemase